MGIGARRLNPSYEALIERRIEELKQAARKDWQAYRQRRGKEK